MPPRKKSSDDDDDSLSLVRDRAEREPERPVPVAPSTDRAEPIRPAGIAVREAAAAEPPPILEVHAQDLPLAAAAAVLALSTFLSWYRGPQGVPVTASGWATGWWGPLVFFFALASLAIVVLRRAGMRPSLPVEESLVHEGVGYVAVIGVLLKSRFRPGIEGFTLGIGWGIWLGVVAAAAVALLGARMGPRAPLVLRPAWYRGRPGRIGATVIAVALAGGVGLGAAQSFDVQKAIAGRSGKVQGPPPNVVRGKLPDCAADVPVPRGVTPLIGYEGTGARPFCIAQLRSTLTPARLAALFKRELTRRKWTFEAAQQQAAFQTLVLRKPHCGTMAFVQGQEGGSIAQVALGECPQGSS